MSNSSRILSRSISLGYLKAQPYTSNEVKQARNRITADGYVYLCDIGDEFDHLSFLSEFGELMPQYDGKLVWDLKPEPDMDDVYHSRNTRALVPHTEAYEIAGDPPRMLALWGIKPAQGPGGETTLADGDRWLETFTTAERALMTERVYEWRSTEGLARRDIFISSMHPILTLREDRSILRYSHNNLVQIDDGFVGAFVDSGWDFFETNKEAVSIERNSLLIWDNWRMLHSRNAFADRGRHLKRVLIK